MVSEWWRVLLTSLPFFHPLTPPAGDSQKFGHLNSFKCATINLFRFTSIYFYLLLMATGLLCPLSVH